MKIIFNLKFYDLLSHMYMSGIKKVLDRVLKIFNSSDFLKTVPVDTLHQMRGTRTIKMKRQGPGIRGSSQEKYSAVFLESKQSSLRHGMMGSIQKKRGTVRLDEGRMNTCYIQKTKQVKKKGNY